MVAAWIRALTGVGPSIASGSQTCSGNCADLPMDPQKIRTAVKVATEIPRAVKREAEALRLDSCLDVRISMFDREAGVWAITFTRRGRRKAILMWTVEVDV